MKLERVSWLAVAVVALAGCSSGAAVTTKPTTASVPTLSAMQNWDAGAGGKDLAKVHALLSAMEETSDFSPAAGSALFHALPAAMNHPPPDDPGAYTKVLSMLAVGALALAGSDDATALKAFTSASAELKTCPARGRARCEGPAGL